MPKQIEPYTACSNEIEGMGMAWFKEVENCDVSSAAAYGESIFELSKKFRGNWSMDCEIKIAEQIAKKNGFGGRPLLEIQFLVAQGIILRRALWKARWRERLLVEIQTKHDAAPSHTEKVKLWREYKRFLTMGELERFRKSQKQTMPTIAEIKMALTARPLRDRDSRRKPDPGSWHQLLTQEDMADRLGCTRYNIIKIFKEIIPRPKAINQGSEGFNPLLFYEAKESFRVLAAYLKRTNRGDGWISGYIYGTAREYRECFPSDLDDFLRRLPSLIPVRLKRDKQWRRTLNDRLKEVGAVSCSPQ